MRTNGVIGVLSLKMRERAATFPGTVVSTE